MIWSLLLNQYNYKIYNEFEKPIKLHKKIDIYHYKKAWAAFYNLVMISLKFDLNIN